MRLATVLVLAALIIPAAADAKGTTTVRVCGAEACSALEDRAAYSGLIGSNAGAERALLWYVPRTKALEQLAPAVRELEPFEAPAAWPAAVEAQPMEQARTRGWSNDLLAGSVIPMILAAAAVGRRSRRIQPRPA